MIKICYNRIDLINEETVHEKIYCDPGGGTAAGMHRLRQKAGTARHLGQRRPGYGLHAGDDLYKNSSYTLRFTKNEEGKWQWKDDTTLPLDQTLMQQLLDQVSALNTLTPLENPGDITAYDLDGPDRTLEVKNDDGTGLSLQIGAAAEGGGYYMCRDKDTTKIYVAPDALVQLMDRNIYELVQMPTLPALTADKLTHIQARGGGMDVTVARGEGDSWLCSGADVSDRMTALTALLAEGMKLESCVDYNPSSGALPICGLTDPAATVTVNYLTSTGSTDSFTVYIGLTYEDGYFAMYNDVPAIFKVSAATAQALLDLLTLGA